MKTLLFLSECDSLQLVVHENAVSSMLTLCRNAGDIETGGIITGTYSDDGRIANVQDALGPSEGSVSTQNSFMRSATGLAAELERRWAQRQYYLGEWHSHPLPAGTPSHQDRFQMDKISKDPAYYCPKPILLVLSRHSNEWKVGAWLHTQYMLTPLH